MSFRWIKVSPELQRRSPLFRFGWPLPVLLVLMAASIGASIYAALLAQKLLALAVNSHTILKAYCLVQGTQLLVALVGMACVVTRKPVRRVIKLGFVVLTLFAITMTACVYDSIEQANLVSSFLERLASEPFYGFSLLLDPFFVVADLIASYLVRMSDYKTTIDAARDLLAITVACLVVRDLPLWALASFSKRVRLACEGEIPGSEAKALFVVDPKKLKGRHYYDVRIHIPIPGFLSRATKAKPAKPGGAPARRHSAATAGKRGIVARLKELMS